MQMTEETQFGPQIVVAFQNYVPPFDVEKAVNRMLRIVPPKYLWGLHTIVLTNVEALSRTERDRKTWGRHRRVTLSEVRGYYTPEWSGGPAHITILVDNLEERMGKWRRLAFARDAALAELLFHELGHHIHRVHKPKYEDKEDVADKWSKNLTIKFLRDRYWYLVPIAAPVALFNELTKDIAKLYRRLRS